MKWLLILLLSISALAQDPVDVAKSYIGESENLGPNRSINIDRWNRFANAPVGSYWCASFVSAMYHQGGYVAPVTAWSPAFFTNPKNLVKLADIRRNDAIGFYFPKKGRIAHIGLIERLQGAYIVTVEGNTSDDAGIVRDGGGVYRKFRPVKLMDNRNRYSRFQPKAE